MARYASKGSIHAKSAEKEAKQTDEEESNGEYVSEENNTEEEGTEEYTKAEEIPTFDGLHDWSIAMNADEALIKRMKRFIAAWIDDNWTILSQEPRDDHANVIPLIKPFYTEFSASFDGMKPPYVNAAIRWIVQDRIDSRRSRIEEKERRKRIKLEEQVESERVSAFDNSSTLENPSSNVDRFSMATQQCPEEDMSLWAHYHGENGVPSRMSLCTVNDILTDGTCSQSNSLQLVSWDKWRTVLIEDLALNLSFTVTCVLNGGTLHVTSDRHLRAALLSERSRGANQIGFEVLAGRCLRINME